MAVAFFRRLLYLDQTEMHTYNLSVAIEALTSSSCRRFSLDEIKKATNNFRKGSYNIHGFMEYVANISCYDVDGQSEPTLLVVKRYNDNDAFWMQIRPLMNIEVHPNIIDLIGYCIESYEKILVFKYMENGSLEDYLQKGSDDKIRSWEKWVELCIKVGYGLQHLHRYTTKFPYGLIHGDFNAHSILLDENLDPNITDFSRSRMGKTHFCHYRDIIGFGRLLSKVYSLQEKKTDAFDSRDDNTSPGSLILFKNTINKCLHAEEYNSPTVEEVVLDLKAVLKLQEYLFPLPSSKKLDLLNSSTKESTIIEGVTESNSLDELNGVTNSSKKNMPSSSSISFSQKDSSSSSSSLVSSSSSSLNISSSSSSFNLFTPSYRKFSLSEINKVTNNLDEKTSLREGLFWIEYLVQMNLDSETEKTWATVKQFKRNYTDEFKNEIQTVSKIQAHPNLIGLIGYCIESGENILIYNDTEHGSLHDYVKQGGHICLSWKERLNICLGAVLGLQHLHEETNEFPDGIIHGDLNPANILLDENWTAKVSNYAGSHVAQIRSSISTTTVKDPFAHHAPEIESSNHLTKKVDVYAFGIILFQVICRRKIWVQGEESKLGYIEESYARWANENIDIGIKDDLSRDSLRAFTDCIGKCLESNPYKRPTMKRVVLDIQNALNFQEGEGEATNFNASFRTKSSLTEGGPSMSRVLFSLSSSSCRRFPMNEIKDATNNFEAKKQLGKGGEGTVYLAQIHLDSKTEKLPVAVKVLNKEFIGEFEKEIATVTKIKHPNIVSLLGYCRELDDKVLIYEYMGKGSLTDYVKMNSKVCLSWKQRLNICLGAAYGLQHLHRETEEFPYGIIHRDVKPENILINDNWDAKVSDFGMLKLSTVAQTRSTIITVHTRGTPGYIAPECSILPDKQLTRKIDVYSFGLVMFEVLCLMKRWEVGDDSIYVEENEDVALLADENIDIKIKHQISEASKYKFIDMIAASLRLDPKRRPSMNDVVHNLEAALKYQEQSEISTRINAPS